MSESTDYVFGFTDAIRLVNAASKVAKDKAAAEIEAKDPHGEKSLHLAMGLAETAEALVEYLKRKQGQ